MAINENLPFDEMMGVFVDASTSRLPVYRDTLDEVMQHALVKHSDKASLVERLEAVIDRLTPANTSISPA